MLDGDCAFATAADPDDEIDWGAYLGMPGEILISGKVRDVTARIRQARADARPTDELQKLSAAVLSL